MGKEGKVYVWVLVVLAAIGLAVLGYYLLSQSRERVEEPRSAGEKAVIPGEETRPPASQEQGAAVDDSTEQKGTPSKEAGGPKAFSIEKQKQKESGEAKELPADAVSEIQEEAVLKIEVGADMGPQVKVTPDFCSLIDDHVYEFFMYLSHRPYVKALDLEQTPFECFQEILDGLATHPPLPAGERADPAAILQNMYHLYRVLGFQNIRLIKTVLAHEQDNLEINLDIFYKWLMSGDRCSKSGLTRPPVDVIYQYAGFFLNTIGGRAYLFRRSPSVRLLITYYAVLIVHRADRSGKNTYGIDVLPTISILKEEISHTTTLEYRMNYVDRLAQLEDYYLKKR
ncbi:MAG: hypothetical protein ACLFUL_03640 [Desulfobacteraceae bacterium]